MGHVGRHRAEGGADQRALGSIGPANALAARDGAANHGVVAETG